ncbi:MAG: CoA pyrophosphatase [Magnetococcales bacterium]|nr:CoA pyrophosphatase [Magnetococcales bacterium]
MVNPFQSCVLPSERIPLVEPSLLTLPCTESCIVEALYEKSGPVHSARFSFPTSLVEAAVIIPLIPRERSWDLLFIRRTEGIAHHPGQIAFPGGRAEAEDSSPLHTALREMDEELGIRLDASSILGFLPPAQTQKSGFLIHPFVARLDAPFILKPDPGEVSGTILIPLLFFLEKVNLSPSAEHFDHQGNVVWGATARVMTQLSVALLTRMGCAS